MPMIVSKDPFYFGASGWVLRLGITLEEAGAELAAIEPKLLPNVRAQAHLYFS